MTTQNETDTLSRLKQLDAVCQRFEDCWREGGNPRVEDYLGQVPEEYRSELLGELLLLEWDYRSERRDVVTWTEYAQRFSHWPAELASVWDAWQQRNSAAAVTTESLPKGRVNLAGYQDAEAIGRGGMGEVYRAFDPRLQRMVALKKVRLERATADTLARFRNEALALGRLHHPHIVAVHEYCEIDGEPCLVMEYVAGGVLEERLRKNAPLAPAETARLMEVLAWAVHAAHEAGIIHRDLKPENVLMAAEVPGSPENVLGGFAKVTDFGLAALIGADQRATRYGDVFGTAAYMAPEQAMGRTRDIGPPTDVWALGVILYRCLTGLLPFKGDSVMETLDRVKSMQFQPPRKVRPDVPRFLEEVCLACLAKLPQDRPTARELAERLRHWEALQAVPRFMRPRWRLGLGLSVGAVLIVLLLGGGVLARWLLDREPTTTPLQVTFDVVNWEWFREKDIANGRIGENVQVTHIGERVVVRVELSEPAYCYLVALNFDGKEQLLWPCDPDSAAGLDDQIPTLVQELLYPPITQENPPQSRALVLDDDQEGGMQAYLVVASRKRLPAYREWVQERGPIPWQRLPAGQGVWRSDGSSMDPVQPGQGRVRGSLVVLRGLPALPRVCQWAGKDVTAEAIAFPVLRKEGR